MLSPERQNNRMSKITNDDLTQSSSYTHVATVGVKRLIICCQLIDCEFVTFVVLNISTETLSTYFLNLKIRHLDIAIVIVSRLVPLNF